MGVDLGDPSFFSMDLLHITYYLLFFQVNKMNALENVNMSLLLLICKYARINLINYVKLR